MSLCPVPTEQLDLLARPHGWTFVLVHSPCLNLEPALQWGFLRTGCPLGPDHLIASGNGSYGCGDQLNKAQ